MIVRVRFQTEGSHVHCRLFLAPAANRTFAKCGEFTVRAGEEFEVLREAFTKAEFVEEEAVAVSQQSRSRL